MMMSPTSPVSEGETTEALDAELTSHDTSRDDLLLMLERSIKIYYSLFLALVGSVFNIISVIVLSRASFRRTATSVYLRYLACVDMFVLYNGLSGHLVQALTGYNIQHYHLAFCKFNIWARAFAPDLSSWILVAVTTERALSIVLPHRVRSVCSRLTASASILSITVLAMGVNMPMLLLQGTRELQVAGSNTTVVRLCSPLSAEFEDFFNSAWYWLDISKFIFIPGAILVVFNIVILIFVIRSRRRVLKRASSQADPEIAHPHVTGPHTNHVTGSRREISLTVTLLAINATYILCNSPLLVYQLGSQLWFPPGNLPPEKLTRSVVVMTMYTNNAVNFLLYCATGSKFRAETRVLFSPVRHCCVAMATRRQPDGNGNDRVLS